MYQRFETFTVLINRISRNIRKIKNQEMAEYGLRSSHISCLYYLYSTKGLTATELCEKCEEDKATVSRALEFLQTGGYIEYQSKTIKRYKAPILLTEKGFKTGREIAAKIDNILEEVSTGISPKERESFYRYLSLISNNLENITQKYEK